MSFAFSAKFLMRAKACWKLLKESAFELIKISGLRLFLSLWLQMNFLLFLYGLARGCVRLKQKLMLLLCRIKQMLRSFKCFWRRFERAFSAQWIRVLQPYSSRTFYAGAGILASAENTPRFAGCGRENAGRMASSAALKIKQDILKAGAEGISIL